MRIVFMGTPEFAVPTLKMLHDGGHELLVITQPDKRQGRKQLLMPPPIKVFAIEHDIPIGQFSRIKSEEGVKALLEFAPDLMVTAAYGQILSQQILDIPKMGCINVHASLLPKYRGAAPIQKAIMDGERITGITTMMTDAGLDTGDILLKREVKIGDDETAGELTERLAHVGADVLFNTLTLLNAGTLKRIPQEEAQSSKCSPVTREMGRIDFTKSAIDIHNLVRAMNPWPGAYALLNGDIIKIWKTTVSECGRTEREDCCGACLTVRPKEGILINTGQGIISVLELQPQNGKRMDAQSFLNGKTGQALLGGILT